MAALSFRSKVLVLPIGAGIALSAIILVMLWNSLGPLERIERTHLPAVRLSSELLAVLETLQIELRDAVALEDLDQLLATDELALRFAGLLEAAPEPGAASRLSAAFSAYYEIARRVSEQMIRTNFEGISTDELLRMEGEYVGLRDLLEKDVERARDHVTAGFATTRRSHRQLVAAMGTLLLLCLIGLALGARSVFRHVTRPLASLTGIAQRLGAGDLTAADALPGGHATNDEVGVLVRGFEHMCSSLRDLVVAARSNSMSVAEVAESLGGESKELQATVSRAEEAVAEIDEAIGRVGGSVSEVVANVGSLSGIARASSNSISELSGTVDLVVCSIDQQSDAIEETAGAIEALAGAIGQITDGATTLSDATDRSATSLAEFTEAMDSISARARSGRELAVQMSSRADTGLGKVEETQHGMDRIQRSVAKVGVLVDSLSEQSRSVNEINRVIRDVVEETNLLALNASIIAAQAGEHGRAFAVVAEEVRNLANRTAMSTGEIQGIVGRVQEEIGDAAAAVKESVDLVGVGVGLSRAAGRELRSIQEDSRLCLEEISGIAEATAAQGAGLKQVQEAGEQVREIVVQLRGASENQARESERVRGNVEEMRSSTLEVRTASTEQRAQSGSLANSVHELASRIEQIAAEAARQEESAMRISSARGVVQQAVDQNSRLATRMKDLVSTLLDRSGELESDISRFRV